MKKPEKIYRDKKGMPEASVTWLKCGAFLPSLTKKGQLRMLTSGQSFRRLGLWNLQTMENNMYPD